MDKDNIRNEKASSVKTLILLHVVFLLFSVLGIASKLAANEEFFSFRFFMFYGAALLNLAVYAVVWQQFLKRMPLTVAYANKAVTVFWALIWGKLFFDEPIGIWQVAGMIIVMAGIIMVVTDVSEDRKEDRLIHEGER